MKHPEWTIKYVHHSKINAVKIVNWEDHHEIATIRDVYQFNGKQSEGAKAARLIAAAPELLEVLERATDQLVNALELLGDYRNGDIETHNETVKQARAAIVKAKG